MDGVVESGGVIESPPAASRGCDEAAAECERARVRLLELAASLARWPDRRALMEYLRLRRAAG